MELEDFNSMMEMKHKKSHQRSDSVSLFRDAGSLRSHSGESKMSLHSIHTTPPESPMSYNRSSYMKTEVVDLDQITHESERFKRRLSEGKAYPKSGSSSSSARELRDRKGEPSSTNIFFRSPFRDVDMDDSICYDWNISTTAGKMWWIKEDENDPRKLSAYDFLSQEPSNAECSPADLDSSACHTFPSSSIDIMKQYSQESSKTTDTTHNKYRPSIKKIPSRIKRLFHSERLRRNSL